MRNELLEEEVWGIEVGSTGRLSRWHRLVDGQRSGLVLESNTGSHAALLGGYVTGE